MGLLLEDSLFAFSILVLAAMSICCIFERLLASRRASKVALLGEAENAEEYPLLEKAPLAAADNVRLKFKYVP